MQRRIQVCVLPLALALGACSGGMEDAGPGNGETAVANTKQASTAYNFDTWTRRPMPAHFCTRLDNAQSRPNQVLSAASYNVIRGWVIDALRQTWGQVPGVTFVDDGNCGQGNLDVTVAIAAADPTMGFGDIHGLSPGGDGYSTIWVLDADLSSGAAARTKATAVHEVGHALGLKHEHQMPGAQLCPSQQLKLTACTSCMDAACPAADYNNCFPPYLATSDPMLFGEGDPDSDPDAVAYANQQVADIGQDPTAEPLTLYDPVSIMNYCNLEDGRDPLDWMPTQLDMLGMEMLYPDSRTYPVGCASGCFYAGNGIIMRGSGAFTTGWTARGAVNITFANGAQLVPGSLLQLGMNTLNYTFLDPRAQAGAQGGATLNGGGLANRSEGLHTALVGATTWAVL